MWRYCCTHEQRVSGLLDTARATPLRDNKTITTHEAIYYHFLSPNFNQTDNKNLTFVEAGEVEPLFSGTPHQQTPRFSQGIGDRIPPCRCHLLLQWIFRGASGRWSWSVPCWRPPSPAKSSGRWSPTFSSSDTRILGPQAGLPPTPTSRLPPPSSKVSGGDLEVCVERKRISGCRGLKRGSFWGVCETGGIQFYTVENLARNVPDRGHSGSDPPPWRREKKRSSGQSKAAKLTEVVGQAIRSANGKAARVGRCVVFTNDNNNKNSRRKQRLVEAQADTQIDGEMESAAQW